MTDFSSHQQLELGSERAFGLVFTLAILAFALAPMLKAQQPHYWWLAGAGILFLISIVRPRLLRVLNLLWFKFGLLLGSIVSPLLMAFIFFGIFTPIALCLRLLGKDLLNLKFNPARSSYWIDREKAGQQMGSMKNQF